MVNYPDVPTMLKLNNLNRYVDITNPASITYGLPFGVRIRKEPKKCFPKVHQIPPETPCIYLSLPLHVMLNCRHFARAKLCVIFTTKRIIHINNINWLVLVMETRCVYYEVGTEVPYIRKTNFRH